MAAAEVAAAEAAAPEDADCGNSTEVRDEVGETNIDNGRACRLAKSEKAVAKYLYHKIVPLKQVDRYNIITGCGQGCHLRQISVG